MKTIYREMVTDLFEIEPQAALKLLGSLSANSGDFEEKFEFFHKNYFEALSATDDDFDGSCSDSEQYSENGYPSSDLEDY
jgi:hypothetical protein